MINRLSIHIRSYALQHFSHENLKLLSFGISLVSCLLSGSILLFPLMSENLIDFLNFKVVQVNIISSLSQLGMYLCLPVLGYLSDIYGTNLLAMLAIFLLVPAYFVNYLILKSTFPTPTQLVLFCITFGLIGLGTSSLYFSSLLTCSKIYPKRKGLSISLPVACYGLSSLIGSQILKLSYFKYSSTNLDLFKVFKFFSLLYLIIGIANFLATSIVVDHKQLYIDETTELIPISSIEPPNHQQKFMNFLKSNVMWFLMMSFFLNIGPLEAFQNNLNSILKHLNKASTLSEQIGLLSIFSTSTRLFVGVLSDYMDKLWILIAILLISCVNQYLSINYTYVSLITVINGVSYGGIFTIYPTIISEIWGVDILGSTWGLFMIAPALSSTLFSLIYGNLLDNSNDVTKYFRLSTLSYCISLMFVIYILVNRKAFGSSSSRSRAPSRSHSHSI